MSFSVVPEWPEFVICMRSPGCLYANVYAGMPFCVCARELFLGARVLNVFARVLYVFARVSCVCMCVPGCRFCVHMCARGLCVCL